MLSFASTLKNRASRWMSIHFPDGNTYFALWVLLLAIVAHSFASYTFIGRNVWHYLGNDYPCFYRASRDLWLGNPIYPETIDPDSLWDERPGTRRKFWGGYVYPAVYAVLLWPFSWLPLFWSRKVFVLFSILVYAWIFRDILRSYLPRTVPWAFLACFVVWFWWGPALQTIRMAQSNTVVLLFLYASWRFARNESPFISGVFLGLAATLKLTPLVILPLLLVRKQWRILLGAWGSFFLTLLICFPGVNWTYFRYLLPATARLMELPGQPCIPVQIGRVLSQAGIISEGGSGVGWLFTLGLSGLLYLGVLWIAWRNRERWHSSDLLLYGIGVMPVFTAEQAHHYMVSALPFLVLLIGMLKRGVRVTERSVSLAMVAGILLWAPIPYHLSSLGMLWSGIESVTSIRHLDLLLFSQATWLFVLWPFLFRPTLVQGRAEGDSTTCQKK